MGNSQSYFAAEELQDYQDLTYLSKTEILHVFKRFKNLIDESAVGGLESVEGSGGSKKTQRKQKREYVIPIDTLITLDELKNNPFSDRICQVFCSSEGGMLMTFEDFLDMMSVFSDNAPKQIKVEYAFKIYDFDDDDVLGHNDLCEIVNRLTGGRNGRQNRLLSQDNMDSLIHRILEEADLDGDGQISFAEFEHVISKSPDFINSFRIRL